MRSCLCLTKGWPRLKVLSLATNINDYYQFIFDHEGEGWTFMTACLCHTKGQKSKKGGIACKRLFMIVVNTLMIVHSCVGTRIRYTPKVLPRGGHV